MNISYLKEYISRHLHTYIRLYNFEKKTMDSFCARYDFNDSDIFLPHVLDFFCTLANEEIPILVSLSREFIYGIVHSENTIFIAGPIRTPSLIHLNHDMDDIPYDESLKANVPILEIGIFTDKLLLLHNLFHNTPVSEGDIILRNCSPDSTESDIQIHFSDIVFKNHEYGELHNPYDQEVREFSSIENGDVEQLKKSWEEDYMGKLGVLAKDDMRNNKNLGIVLVTLASRAAIRGGVLPEVSFSLSDSYINKLEECKTATEAYYLARQSEYEYACMVRDIRRQTLSCKEHKDQNPRISKCKEYIFAHLHEKISIRDIADELHLNPNYLSMIFKEHEGITIGNYILREKITLTRNLLTYSQHSYIEIATYLGFSSQSHLGKYFKKETGMTLRQYRDIYGVRDF